MFTRRFNRPATEPTALIYIRQAQERLADPDKDRDPNDTVLVVLGAVLTGIQDLSDRLPGNGNGIRGKAKQATMPVALVTLVLERLASLMAGY